MGKPRKRIPRKCEICGKPFLARPCDIKRGRGRFCSRQCSNVNLQAAFAARVQEPGTQLQKQVRSSGLINMRVRRGQLKRPDRCSQCGKIGRVDGHHDDYGRPDQVRWLCRSCHMKLHLAKEAAQ